MKECPNCHELVGDSVKVCFNCHYDFSLGRVVDSSRIAEERRNEELRIQQLKEAFQGVSINATINQTILIFERRIKGEKY
ncbi:hypothetical protein [Eisenbergiella sp.]